MPNTINLNVSPGQTRTITFNCGSTYVLDDIVFIISGEDSDSDASLELLEEVTYVQLKNLRDTGGLVPGKFYRMTDFVTTTKTPSSALPTAGYTYKSAMHPFDLVLLAVSKYELDHRAIAILSDDDASVYFKNCDLLKWQIWYDMDNDDTKYTWAASLDTGGKGVIYRMIDERGNDCPYDFKNILFVRSTDNGGSGVNKASGTLNWVYTFCEAFKDKSVSSSMSAARNNVILKFDNVLNDVVMIGKKFEGNSFGYRCREITISSKSNQNNKFGNNCYKINLTNASYNTFGDGCYEIDMEGVCSDNTFGNNCTQIYLGEYCKYNVFGDNCVAICFGDDNRRYGDYVENVIIRNNVNKVNLYRSGGSSTSKLQNIYIAQGVRQTTITSITRNNIYRTTVAMLTDSTVRIYKEDEEAIHYLLGNTLCIGGYPPNYLTLTNVDGVDASVKITSTMTNVPVIYYSFDGSSWDVFPIDGGAVRLSTSTKMYFKGYNSGGLSDYSSNKFTRFSISSAKVELGGSVQSLVDGVGWSPNAVEMWSLFQNCTTLKSVEQGILPATNLVDHCYHNMFSECTALYNTPNLPAETLSESCYEGMFCNCIDLSSVMAELPAITATKGCYRSMFEKCTGLDSAPDLRAKTLDRACYMYMFKNSGLKKAPQLNAEVLAKECYYEMFNGCTNLIYIYCTAINITEQDCTTNWVKGVASSGTFTRNLSTTWTTGFNGIPSGWTVLTV